MRTLHLVAAFLAMSSLVVTACEEAPICGDGVVGRGETESSCCVDTGCSAGVCDEDSRRCVDPWIADCGGSEACLDDGPYLCRRADVPAYDCAACGCPDDGRCEEGVCWSLDEIRARRAGVEISTSLDLDEYLTLVDDLQRPQLTLDELVTEVRARARTDRRYAVLLFGLTSASDLEQAIMLEIKRRLDEAGLETEPDVLSLLDESSLEQACTTAREAAGERLADDEGVLLVASAADTAHRETCFYEEHWPRCGPPTLDGCVLRADRLPLSLLVVDFEEALDATDRALLIRATNRPAGERLFHLDQAVSRWRQSIDTWPAPDEYAVELQGARVIVRAMPSSRYDDTWWVAVPAPARSPWGLLGFRLLWADADTQAFLSQYDIVGRDCVWSVAEDAAEVSYECEGGGARVQARIDATTQTVIELERTPPG